MKNNILNIYIMKKSFKKTRKVKKKIELNKKKDGTYGIEFNKFLKIKIVPGKDIPGGLRYGDKIISIDGIKINNKSDLDNAIRTRYVLSFKPADFVFEGLYQFDGEYNKKSLSKLSMKVSSSKALKKSSKKSSSKSSKKSSSKSSKKSSSKSSKGSKRKSFIINK